MLAALSGTIVMAACSGDDGATGAPGAIGATGPAGPAGASANPGDGGAVASLPTSCLSPCHGFNGVVSQFQSSAHYVAYQENLGTTEAKTWTTTGSPCGNCHAIDALEQRVSRNVLTSSGAVANLSSGQLQYRNSSTNALASASYAGSALVAEVYCTTCHAVTNANDPHKTGATWTPGSFPLRVPANATATNIEKSPASGAVTGTQVAGFGAGTTCMWCHRSRVDVTNYLTDTNNALTNVHWGPHEGPQADIFTGAGGYHFGTKSYAQSTHEKRLTCTDCHMVAVADNANVPDHSFAAKVTACTQCHATATTFDVNGAQGRIKAALTEIETWLNNQGVLTRAEAAPYTALTAGQLGDGNWATDMPIPGAKIGGALMTRDQAGALYDYLLVARGGAYGVHNPIYVSQLLWDSYYALTGTALASIPTRP